MGSRRPPGGWRDPRGRVDVCGPAGAFWRIRSVLGWKQLDEDWEVWLSKYFLGWDRDNRVIQTLGGGLIILAVVGICIDACTSAHWGGPVAGGCAILLAILTVMRLNGQAPRRRKQS